MSTGEPARKEWEAGLKELAWLRGELDEADRRIQPILCVGDGNYDVREIWKALPSGRLCLTIRSLSHAAAKIEISMNCLRLPRRPVHGGVLLNMGR